MKLSFLNFVLLCFILLSSCSGNVTNDLLECDGAICTLDFKTITVNIKDEQGNPVVLDSFKVINIANGEDVTMDLSTINREYIERFGAYPIASDRNFKIPNQQYDLQFTGFINDSEVINENYVIATDCCHVSLVSGNNNVTLSN